MHYYFKLNNQINRKKKYISNKEWTGAVIGANTLCSTRKLYVSVRIPRSANTADTCFGPLYLYSMIYGYP